MRTVLHVSASDLLQGTEYFLRT